MQVDDVDESELLVRFKDKHEEMAVAELKALCELFGAPNVTVGRPGDRHPFFHVRRLPSHLCPLICERAMLVAGFFDVYGEGKTLETALTGEERPFQVERMIGDALAPGVSLKVAVEIYGASLTHKEKSERIFRLLSFVPKRVHVDLNNPTLKLYIMEQMWSRNNIDNHLHRVFVSREVCVNNNTLPTQFQLRERPFLNTTSMDPLLSFVMANMGLCKPGTVVFDPFVGSGSVLVSCAHFGSYCYGSDYDPRVFRGDTPEQNIAANFAHYNFRHRFLGVIRADFSQKWMSRRPLFDAIVTDPPYGVREGIRKIGRGAKKKKKDVNLAQLIDDGYVHIPMRTTYPYDELLSDLLSFAAETLVPGGRLIFWHAAAKEVPIEDFSVEEDLPHHPDMELLNVGLQVCGTVNRRLILYKKKNTK